ncbi:MAG TPA: DUF2059 domain-containing protein [Kiritimatiellia bacterium]|nr:DUF2059 domain-containing protein [Kiritimatiellia bacterium]
MKKKMLIVIAALASTAVAVRAESDDRRELAAEVIIAMEAEQLLKENIAAMKENFVEQMAMMSRASPGADIAEAQEKILGIIEESMSWDAVRDDFIDLYSTLFDAPTLKGLLAFYQSEVGREFVRKMPELTARSQEISMKRMSEVMPRMMEVMQQLQPSRQPSRPALVE